MAWTASFAISSGFLLYSRIYYRSIFFWQFFSTLMWLSISIIVTLSSFIDYDRDYKYVTGEFVAAVFFLLSIIFKHQVEKIIVRKSNTKMSMKNNLYEFERLLILLSVVLFIYVDVYIGIVSVLDNKDSNLLGLIRTIYYAMLLVIVAYEYIRVRIVRSQLIKEEWWPIVSESGKQIGTIQEHASLWDEQKYTHPVVRVVFLKGNKLFLQEHAGSKVFGVYDWDLPISVHVRVGETSEDAIHRVLGPEVGFAELNFVLLTNYKIEEAQEFQFVYLYVASDVSLLRPNMTKIRHQKWWTMQQLEENINSGIFSEQFRTELEILKRSGLVESIACDCDCKLKETFS